jgi:hypothetical protein
MALTVEDGTGLAGADSYVTVAEADEYALEHYLDDWFQLTDDTQKEAALRKAALYLDSHYRASFLGRRYSETQSLEWPRYDATDRNGWVLDLTIPEDLKRAQIELAVRSLAGDLQADRSRGGAVKREKVDVIEVEYFDGAPGGTRYVQVDEYLSRLLKAGGGQVRIARV